MKKVLVLSLVLVMALAGTVFAGVNFSGEFTGEIKNNEVKFLDGLGVASKLSISIGADGSEENSWSFEADASLEASAFKLGKYLLTLTDEYFDMYFWGNGKELSNKGTTLGLISAGKAAAGHRARLVVDAVDPVTLTTDFTDNELYVFADANIAGYDAGLAYKRSGETDLEDAANTVGLWGKAEIDMFTLQADLGATFLEGDDDKSLAFGYGAKVTAEVTDEVTVYAQYKGKQEGFDNAGWPGSQLELNATYDDSALKVAGTFTQELDEKTNKVKAEAYYRFSDALDYGDLFKSDKYFNNTAPAVGLVANLADFSVEDVTLNVASPVVEDMVWARAMAKYAPEGDENFFEVGAYAHVKVTNKLTVEPSVEYKTKDSVIDLTGKVSYLIGSSEDVALNLTVQKVMVAEDADEAEAKEVLSAGVTVKF
jgi:hypothetical protein